MNNAFFLTGTDTEIGKTFTACALLHAWRKSGFRAVGYKPIAAGSEQIDGQFANADAIALQQASSEGFSPAQINPICLDEPIAPHIAAATQGISFDFPALLQGYQELSAQADRVLVEGVGGFLVPLDTGRNTGDLAKLFGLPIILVVGMRLGCLSHALLTVEAIAARGLSLSGWVANALAPTMSRQEENIATLRERIAAPCLGVIPQLNNAEQAARYLDVL